VESLYLCIVNPNGFPNSTNFCENFSFYYKFDLNLQTEQILQNLPFASSQNRDRNVIFLSLLWF